MQYLVSVGRLNLVILCSQIGRCNDEVHVEICVIIFLKLDGIQLQTVHTGRSRQNAQHVIQRVWVYTHITHFMHLF